MKQLGLALHNYHDTYNRFPAGIGPCVYNNPPDTPPCAGWNGWGGLASLTAYIEQGALYNRIQWGWAWNNVTPSGNRSVTDSFVNAFVCPSDSVVRYTTNMGPTSYNLSHGPCSAWDVADGQEVGMFDRMYWSSMADIRDGSSNTIAMAEGRLGQNAGMWDPSKRDPSYRVVTGTALVQVPAIGNAYTFTNSAADMATIKAYYQNCLSMYAAGTGWDGQSDEQGRFWTCGTAFRASYITTLIGPNAGPACDVDASVTNIDVKEPSSYHPGGVQVLKADGSVSFASETIDQAIWIAGGSIREGETLSLP